MKPLAGPESSLPDLPALVFSVQIRYGWQASLRAPRQWAKTLAAARHSRSADVARIWYHLEVRVGRR